MELTYTQKKHFYDHGYLHIPGVIPRLMLDNAVRAINNGVGQGMNVSDMPRFHSQSFCPEVQQTPHIKDLFNATPLFELIESVVEKGKVAKQGGGQIALRWPSFPPVDGPMPKPHGHLDGLYSPNNGVPKGTVQNFTLLAGVYLSDVLEPYAGNFTAWPGTHWKFQEYFRKHGTEGFENGMPKIEMPEPVQLTGKAGDVFLAHYQLAHSAAPNFSPHTRYAIFFRVTHTDRLGNFRKEALTDIWLEMPGIKKLFLSQEELAAVI